MISPKDALKTAYEIIDEGLPGDDPKVQASSRQLREAIPVAELEHQAADMIGEIVTYLREDGEIEFDSQIYNDADDLHSRLKALK